MDEPINITGYACDKCGKIFLDKEEFDNRHNKNKNQDKNIDLSNQ